MSALARRSALVLALLFGLMFSVGTGVLWYFHQPLWLALLFALAVVAFQYALGPWIVDHIFRIRWANPEELGPEFATWYRRTAAELNIETPRFGIIEDGNPNAFTYGHTRRDARVVVTRGLLDMLEPHEVRAVVAHEFGHVKHNDFIVMTVAQTVPLVMYIVYVWTRNYRRDGWAALAVSVGAYASYIASEYVVLLLSRIREYFADEQAGRAVQNPDALASALVKIAYGLAPRYDKAMMQDWEKQSSAGKKKSKQPKASPLDSPTAAVLGISSIASAPAFAMAASDASGAFSVPAMERAARWEFLNPWAVWFELNSTHPLTARRIRALNAQSRAMGKPPVYALDVVPPGRQYTGNFGLEFLICALPAIGGIGGWILGPTFFSQSFAMSIAPALLGFGIGSLIMLPLSYASLAGARHATVESLVSEIDVSPVNAVTCEVEGTIIGRGVPGLFWSNDLVLRDETGFVMLQYRQPFHVFEFLFGWLKAGKYQGKRARVRGWYRRAPQPYIEVSSIEMLELGADSVRCYGVYGHYALALFSTAAGAFALFTGTNLGAFIWGVISGVAKAYFR